MAASQLPRLLMERTTHRIGSSILMFLLPCLVNIQLFGQQPEMRQFQPTDGIVSNRNNFHLMCDSRGQLWGSSPIGLFRYDGHDFKKYERTDGLTDRFVLRTFESPDGQVWVLSHGGSLYKAMGDSLSLIELPEEIGQRIEFDRCWTLLVDQHNTLWVGNRTSGVWKLDSAGSWANVIGLDQSWRGLGLYLQAGVPPIRFGLYDNGGPQDEFKLYVFQQDTEQPTEVVLPFTDPFKRGNRPYTHLRESGEVLFAFGRDLFCLNGAQVLEHEVKPSMITCVTEDTEGVTWITTLDHGLHRRLPDGDWQEFLPDAHLYWVEQDHEGGIWIASRLQGIFYMPDPSLGIYGGEDSSIPVDGLSYMTVSGSHIYVIGKHTDIHRWRIDDLSEADLETPFKTLDLDEGRINRIHWDEGSSRLWVGAQYRIGSLNENREFEHIPAFGALSKPLSVFDVRAGPDGGVWVVRRDSAKKIVDGHVERAVQCGKQRIHSVVESPNGEAWCGGYKGIWKITGDSLTSMPQEHPAFHSQNYDLLWYKGSLWWTSVNHGLVSLHGDAFTLFNQPAYGITGLHGLWPEADTIWGLAGSHLVKIIVFAPDSIQIEKRWIRHYLNDALFDLVMTKSNVYVTTASGLISFDRRVLQRDHAPGKVLVRRIRVNDRDTLIQPSYDLAAFDNVQVDFAGVSFRNPHINFRYRMSGVDKRWQNTDQRTIRYTQMQPGDYELEIVSQNENGVWGQQPVSIHFTVHPPFWATWWFLLLVFVFLMITSVWFYRWRIQRILQKRDLDQQLLRLESKALRAQINPHFIFNVLSAIQGYVSDGDTKTSEQYLGKFARLIRLILENSRESFVPLEDEVEMLRNYIEMEQMRFGDGLTYDIVCDDYLLTGDHMIPPMIIQPYVENAIVHSASEGTKRVNLSVRFSPHGDEIRCEVCDDGKGILGNETSTSHKPLGMMITRERLALLKPSDSAKPSIQVSNRADEEPGQSGTRIVIYLPVRKDHDHENSDH